MIRLTLAALALLVGCSGDDDRPGTPDGGRLDSGARDAARPDAPMTGPDASSTDGGAADSGGIDAAAPDGATTTDGGSPTDGGSLTGCGALSDDMMRAIVYSGPRVPPGVYFEPDEVSAYPIFAAPCSDSLATTRGRATTMFGASALTGTERSTETFREVDADTGGYIVHYRNTRCDFFDGTTLGGGPHDTSDRTVLLAGYTWWVEYHNLSGSAIAAIIVPPSGPPFTAEVCHLQTVYGDFGLCDEITLNERMITVSRDGATTIAPDLAIRTVTGTCH